MACFIDFATASESLDWAATDIDSCYRHRYAAEEIKSACELIAINSRTLFSHASRFFAGIEHLPLLDRSNNLNWGSSNHGVACDSIKCSIPESGLMGVCSWGVLGHNS